MKLTRTAVPSFFTALNLFFGFVSIVRSHEGDFLWASIFIIIAAFFDSVDGIVARLTNSSSQFGVELDSLADVVSFGAAPAFLVYRLQLASWGWWGMVLSSLLLIFGAIRLARFNVQLVGFDKSYFNGLPIPMQALTISAFVLQYAGGGPALEPWASDLLAPLVVVLSILMVSTVKYDTLPKLSRKGLAENPWKTGAILVGLVALVLSKGSMLFPLVSAVIVFGIVRSLVGLMRKAAPAGESGSV